MPSTITLRDYQNEAITAVIHAWDNNIQRPAVVLPTGTGKSLTMASLALRMHVERGWRILFVAHRGELLNQLKDSIHKLDPKIPVGIVKAEIREYEPDIVVASVETLSSTTDHTTPLGHRDLILVDEAHHYAATSFKQTIEDFGGFDSTSGVHVAGFTATMYREDGGLDQVWDTVVYEKDIEWAINTQHCLVEPRGRGVLDKNIDLTHVHTQAGDFAQGELEEVMLKAVYTCVKAIHDFAEDRHCIVFAVGVKHCKELARALNESSYPARYIIGSTSAEKRQHYFHEFTEGKIKALVTVQVLTEGTDLPICDCVVIARPTQSKNLYSQMVGRGLRLYPDKKDALVIDLGGSSKNMNLMSLTDLTPEATVEGEYAKKKPTSGLGLPSKKKQWMGIARGDDFDVVHGTTLGGTKGTVYRWLSTRSGIEFLDGDMITFLWEDPEGRGYWVGQLASKGEPLHSWLGDPAPYGEARRRAQLAAERSTQRNMKYRIHRSEAQYALRAPTEKQKQLGLDLRIGDVDMMTKGRLSDEITVELVSRRFNRAMQH